MQDKIIDLETKFSFQEDLLQELNEIVIRQQRQIDELGRQVGALKQQIEELEAGKSGAVGHAPDSEKPPHY